MQQKENSITRFKTIEWPELNERWLFKRQCQIIKESSIIKSSESKLLSSKIFEGPISINVFLPPAISLSTTWFYSL